MVLHNFIIQNFLFIDSLNLTFQQGFIALTGETGSGKSLIIKALEFICGGKTGGYKLKDSTKNMMVTCVFNPPFSSFLTSLLQENSLDCREDLILRRVLTPSQKSKCYINDIPISLNLLKNIGSHLIEFVGQFESFELTSYAYHLALLDAFHVPMELKINLKDNFNKWQALYEEVEKNKNMLQKLLEEEAFYKFSLNELVGLHLEKGEEERILSQRTALLQRDKHINFLKEAIHFLNHQTGSLHHLYQSEKTLVKLSAQKDLSSILDKLHQASCLIEESTSSLEEQIKNLEDMPHILEELDQRLYKLRDLARKYKRPIDDLLLLQQELEQKLVKIHNLTTLLHHQEQDLHQALQIYSQAADQLFKARQRQSIALDAAVNQQLKALHWEHVHFKTQIIKKPETSPQKNGLDDVVFQIKTNPGQPFQDIGSISGGERSRLLLALKGALSEIRSHSLLVFDEIDTGVGGKTAESIGQVLKKLANQSQIMAITHAPQVASLSNQHFKVIKTVENQIPSTYCIELDAQTKLEEIARMLSGKVITNEARAAALQLLKNL